MPDQTPTSFCDALMDAATKASLCVVLLEDMREDIPHDRVELILDKVRRHAREALDASAGLFKHYADNPHNPPEQTHA